MIIRIYHDSVDMMDNSVSGVTAWHHDANSDPRDRFVYPILHTFGCQRWNKFSFILEYPACTSAILNKADVVVMPLNDEVTSRPIQPMLSNKPWALGKIT